MTTNNTADDLASRLKEMEEENELLVLQLHQVQEELEQYFLRNQELEKGTKTALVQPAPLQTGPWIDEELPNVHAEVLRLQTLVQVQAKVHQLESKNTLTARLGNLLIQSVETPSGLLGAPAKLIKMWRESTQEQPPAELGGKEFDKVVTAYGNGSFEAVEKLLGTVAISPVMQANAYTALARHLRKTDRTQAAEAARRAHAMDPRTYRLKWLAFRLHEAGQVLEADAMLDLLPHDTPLSESEVRHVGQVRHEAKNHRAREARQKSGFSERRALQEQQLKTLVRARDEQVKLASERATQIEALKLAQTKLAEEKAALLGQRDEQAQLAAKRAAQVEALQQAQAQLAAEKTALLGQHDEQAQLAAERAAQLAALQQAQAQLAVERAAQVEALQQAQAQLAEENAALLGQRDEQAQRAAERAAQVEALQQAQAQLAEEKTALLGQRDEQAQLAAERAAQVEALQQAQAQLAEEKTALLGQRDEQAQLAAERAAQVEALQQAQAQLAEEKTALLGQRDEQAQLAAERAAQVEALQQAQAQLAQEKALLTKQCDEQAKLAAERLKQIQDIQQQLQKNQANEAQLSARQQLMQEELVRAEAQLDLIKDMMLREPYL